MLCHKPGKKLLWGSNALLLGLLLAAPFPRDVASRVGEVFTCNSICSVTVGKGFPD